MTRLSIVAKLVVIGLIAVGFLVKAPHPTSAQEQRPTLEPSCPVVNVNAPDSVNEGTSFFFTAVVARGDASVTPGYNWSISAGTISSGQGTSTIEVTTNGLGAQTVTATVEIAGYNPNCPRVASASSYIVKRPEPRKFDEYGPLAAKTANARLDNLPSSCRTIPALKVTSSAMAAGAVAPAREKSQPRPRRITWLRFGT